MAVFLPRNLRMPVKENLKEAPALLRVPKAMRRERVLILQITSTFPAGLKEEKKEIQLQVTKNQKNNTALRKQLLMVLS